MIVHPALYWTLVVTTSALTLAGASMAANGTIERSSPGHRVPTVTVDGKIRHRVSNNRSGQAVLVIPEAVPGQEGRRRMVLSNAGPRPFTKVTLTQDNLVTGGFSRALQLQVYDAITRRCLYPRPPVDARVPNVAVEHDRCARWMPFDGRRHLRSLVVPGKDGSTTWRRGEQHAIDIRWRLADSSPNSDQGRRASFRLRWHTHAD